ncbi:MAG TPA: adenosine deaminase [Desulfobacteraceae bacterium]|nr:adenosine deaminase [Desulfobacteraceae bacterium]
MKEPAEHNPHHLVMGELVDFLSGRILPDTHDERYRQKIARYLVEHLGFPPDDIRQNRAVVVKTNDHAAKLHVDFLVYVAQRCGMLVKYAPGSLVTRRLSNLALSRIIQPYQIPVVVTTNGEDAEVIDGHTGKVLGEGLTAIPGPDDALFGLSPQPIDERLFEKASRIAYACEIDGACPCDTGVCVINPDDPD